MLKKPLFLSLIFIVAVIAFVSANTDPDGQVSLLSKKSKEKGTEEIEEMLLVQVLASRKVIQG